MIVVVTIFCSGILAQAEIDTTTKMKAQGQINILDERIEAAGEAGIEVGSFEEILNKAIEAYERKGYEEVLTIIGNSIKELETLEMEKLFKKVRAQLTKRKDNRPNLIWLNMDRMITILYSAPLVFLSVEKKGVR